MGAVGPRVLVLAAPPATPWSLRLISHLASQHRYRLVGDLYCLSVDKADSLSDSAGRESAMPTTLWIRAARDQSLAIS